MMVPGIPSRDRGNLGWNNIICSMAYNIIQKIVIFYGLVHKINSIASKHWLLWDKWTLLTSWKKYKNLLENLRWLGVVNFHCMQMVLVMRMQFIFGDDWNDVPCKSLFWSLAMMSFLWNRGPWIFFVACDRRHTSGQH